MEKRTTEERKKKENADRLTTGWLCFTISSSIDRINITEKKTQQQNRITTMISSLIEDEHFQLFVSFVCLPLIVRFAWLSTFVHHDDQRRTNSNLSNDLQIHRQDQTIDDETNFDQNDDQTIEIILKFLNETQRTIVVHSNDKIRKLKRFRFSRLELFFLFINEFVSFRFQIVFLR